jgi:FkbM family methyltransferase
MFMFLLLWKILTKKAIQADGRSWPWPKSYFGRKLNKYLFSLTEWLVRDIEIIDGISHFRFHCTTFPEFRRCVTMFIKEPQTCEWIRSEIKSGQIFYDIGANIGIYSILAAHRVGERGKVYAFEPHSANFSRLLENITANRLGKIVVPCNLAIYSQNDFLPFVYLTAQAGSSSSQLKNPTEIGDDKVDTAISELKYAISIDSLVASGKFPAPHHVKIDVDGGELQILRGMDKLLASSEKPRSIQVEINKGYKEEILAFMEVHNYVWSKTHHTRRGLELIAEGADPEDYVYNAIFQAQGLNPK